MTLAKTSTSTALAIIPKEKKTATAAPSKDAKAPTSKDGVDVKSFDGDTIPADDDGPGAGGGYTPKQDPVEGPGAGGGYDPDEIPADDDGPGAGGGYGDEQDPAESDGPGAGGGYFTDQYSFSVRGHWSQPLVMFGEASYPHDIDVRTEYSPQVPGVTPTLLPALLSSDTVSFTTNTNLVVDDKGHVVKKDAKKDEKKA